MLREYRQEQSKWMAAGVSGDKQMQSADDILPDV